MQPAGNEHNQVVETKFITTKTFFNNTTSFCVANVVFYDNTERKYFPVFALLLIRELLAFGLFLAS
jgi:hypothetical protein